MQEARARALELAVSWYRLGPGQNFTSNMVIDTACVFEAYLNEGGKQFPDTVNTNPEAIKGQPRKKAIST